MTNPAETFTEQYVNGNRNDPLKQGPNTEPARRELFKRLSKAANGFPQRDVVYACMNLILNAIRQDCKNVKSAEKAFDEMIYHSRVTLLGEHYQTNGQRRNVFPFDQHLFPGLVEGRKAGR